MYGRNEWKYILNKEDFCKTVFNLSSLMSVDLHGDEEGFYKVKSLYFDYPDKRCATDVEMGSEKRYKYRIRYYGEAPDHLILEKKLKVDGICYKKSCPISKEGYKNIVKGEPEKNLFQDKLLDEFTAEILKNRLQPEIIVEYLRKAYFETISNTRITFDDNICISSDLEHFLDGKYISLPLMSKDEKLMEVKFDRLLPSYIKKFCQNPGLVQTSFSKYYLGYLLNKGGKINEHYRYY